MPPDQRRPALAADVGRVPAVGGGGGGGPRPSGGCPLGRPQPDAQGGNPLAHHTPGCPWKSVAWAISPTVAGGHWDLAWFITKGLTITETVWCLVFQG